MVAPHPIAKAPAAPVEVASCSICQTPILAGEEQTQCPSCHLTFHAGCWEENFGCSAYGCDQVNVLNPDRDPEPATAAANGDAAVYVEAAHDDHADLAPLPPRHFPIDTLLLALSFVALGLGALLYGGPSAAVLAWALLTLLTKKGLRKPLVIGAIVVSLVGVAAGLATSLFWWKGVKVWAMIFR